MINSVHTITFLRTVLKDIRLIHLAKSGDSLAFVKFYDSYVEPVYRYIYFLAPNNKVAERLTLQVFFKAWETLDRHQVLDTSLVAWLYSLGNAQVSAYYGTHKEVVEPDNDFTMALKGAGFREEFQIIRDGLRSLTLEQQQILVLKYIAGMSNKQIGRVMKIRAGNSRVLHLTGLQALTEYLNETKFRIFDVQKFQGVVEKCLKEFSKDKSSLENYLTRHPEYSGQLSLLLETIFLLHLGHEASPGSTFVPYTRNALLEYMRVRPHRPKVIVTPTFQRAVFTFATLSAVFLVTGTVHAQSALPGDAFYVWKRASEQAWLTLSPDPVATDVFLVERRLNEWLAVSNNSTLNTSARFYYLEALTQLESKADFESLPKIVPALQLQQQTLGNAGLIVRELDNYLFQAASIVETDPSVQNTPTPIVATTTLTSVPTQIVATQTESPTETIATETASPTLVVATETATPTEIVPTETATPTEVVPTETPVPTEVVPTETATPTEVIPTETPVPTEVVPTESPIPTEVVPTEPPAPTATESRTESLSIITP